MKSSILPKLLLCLVAALLVYGGIGKVAQPTQFLAQILAYKLPLPDFFARLTAIVLPWLEVFTGIALFSKSWRPAALGWSLLLFGIFTFVTGQAWLRGLEISCGCFDLQALGANSALSKWMENLGVACLRAVLLCAAVLFIASREQMDRSAAA